MAGTLYIVGTPIGNLEDITFRAVRVLREADLIACEDTRQTRKLLDHYGISRPVVSYHEHNEQARAAELVDKLRVGVNVALVTDAGTPLVADPGYRVVKAAIEAGVRVEPVPGPSALLAALAGSGLATDAFRFGGFLPPKHGQRRRMLETLEAEGSTIVFYEAPHRIIDTLGDIAEVLGPRPVVVARELTKIHEEFLRGSAAEVRDALQSRGAVKGEITLLIGKADTPAEEHGSVEEAVDACAREGMSRMEAIKNVARRRGLSKREVYEAVVKNRG
jgi:16S rRNA (cytidine1402-2'-O)-methyltransferase